MKKILLGLTTTPASDWRGKILEARKFNITEVALFPTFLNFEERKELYSLLDTTPIVSIPHVHLRDDFSLDEIKYLYGKYGTRLFNIHSNEAAEQMLDISDRYRDLIYVENQRDLDKRFYRMIEKCGGICLDCSHYVQYWDINKRPNYSDFERVLNEIKIGCCHLSAISKKPNIDKNNGDAVYSLHTLHNLSEMDYVKDYVKYLPDVLSIELENSFTEQIKIKEYLGTII